MIFYEHWPVTLGTRPPAGLVPDAVATGVELLLIIGAMAGG